MHALKKALSLGIPRVSTWEFESNASQSFYTGGSALLLQAPN